MYILYNKTGVLLSNLVKQDDVSKPGIEPTTSAPIGLASQMRVSCFAVFILKLDAGDRFELPMHLAYETGVVTTLPAVFETHYFAYFTPCAMARSLYPVRWIK